MKRTIHALSFLLLLSLVAGGCRKFIKEENRIEGRWKLLQIERSNFLSWRTVSNDYRSGSFVFFSNGSASYDDDVADMNGQWRMHQGTNGYYDNDNNWRANQRVSLSLELFNFPENRLLKLDFDQVVFRGRNRFLAEYKTPNYRYRYDFRRE